MTTVCAIPLRIEVIAKLSPNLRNRTLKHKNKNLEQRKQTIYYLKNQRLTRLITDCNTFGSTNYFVFCNI